MEKNIYLTEPKMDAGSTSLTLIKTSNSQQNNSLFIQFSTWQYLRKGDAVISGTVQSVRGNLMRALLLLLITIINSWRPAGFTSGHIPRGRVKQNVMLVEKGQKYENWL